MSHGLRVSRIFLTIFYCKLFFSFVSLFLCLSRNAQDIFCWSSFPESPLQGIIQKKSTSGSQMLPFVIFDKKSALFAKSSVILRHFWVKLHKKPFQRFQMMPRNSKLYSALYKVFWYNWFTHFFETLVYSKFY